MIGADAPTIGTEIERKFLLRQPANGPAIVAGLPGTPLLQGYFRDIRGWSVRLRIAAGKAWLTLKSRDANATRWEIESPVPADLAARLLATLSPDQRIGKTRYRVAVEGAPGLAWEIDCFEGRHDGLWLAEIELPHADHPLDLPDWLGEEVTADPRYRNAALAAVPGGEAVPLPPELETVAERLLQTASASAEASGPAPRDRSAGRRAERALRKARLERELRSNLSRRKQQLRGRDMASAGPEAVPGGIPGLDREDPDT